MNLIIEDEPAVFLVTASPEVRRPVRRTLKSRRARMDAHRSMRGFLKACDPSQPGCLLWDTSLPEPDEGLFLALEGHGIHLPVIYISEPAGADVVVRAIKAGAIHFVEKPLDGKLLWEAVREAIAWDGENRSRVRRLARTRRRLAHLTSGESEVLAMLLRGKSNREMADALDLSIRTIEVRRAKLMKKTQARSLAELIRMALAVE